jgi:hypothetical protein
MKDHAIVSGRHTTWSSTMLAVEPTRMRSSRMNQ